MTKSGIGTVPPDAPDGLRRSGELDFCPIIQKNDKTPRAILHMNLDLTNCEVEIGDITPAWKEISPKRGLEKEDGMKFGDIPSARKEISPKLDLERESGMEFGDITPAWKEILPK